MCRQVVRIKGDSATMESIWCVAWYKLVSRLVALIFAKFTFCLPPVDKLSFLKTAHLYYLSKSWEVRTLEMDLSGSQIKVLVELHSFSRLERICFHASLDSRGSPF